MIVADPIFYKTVELMAERLARIEEKLLAADTDALKSLCKIIGVSAGAAQKRCARDAGLRALGVPMPSGQLFFKPAEVIAYFKTRSRNGGR